MDGFETPFRRPLFEILKRRGYDFHGFTSGEILNALDFSFENKRVKRFKLSRSPGVSWEGLEALLDAHQRTLAPHENTRDISALMKLYSLRRWMKLHREALPHARPLAINNGVAVIDLPSAGASNIFAAIKKDRRLLQGQHDANLRPWHAPMGEVTTSHASFVDQANFNALCNVSAWFSSAVQAAINWVNALQAASEDACRNMLPVLRTVSTANYMFSVHPCAFNVEAGSVLRDITATKLALAFGKVCDSDRYDEEIALLNHRERVVIGLDVRVTTAAGTRILSCLSNFLVPVGALRDRHALRFIANHALQRGVKRMRLIEEREKKQRR